MAPRTTVVGLIGGWEGCLCADQYNPLAEAWTGVALTTGVCICSALSVYEDVKGSACILLML